MIGVRGTVVEKLGTSRGLKTWIVGDVGA